MERKGTLRPSVYVAPVLGQDYRFLLAHNDYYMKTVLSK